MKKYLASQIQYPIWAKNDERYKYLDQLDRYLDGEIYDHLKFPFYQETQGKQYIEIKRRRPAFQWNLYSGLSNQVARKVFGKGNAPTLIHNEEKVRLFMEAIKEECSLENLMLEAVEWGSIGSCCITFKLIAFTQGGQKRSKVVARTWRTKQCTPIFNPLGELENLRVHYVQLGQEFLSQNFSVDFENKPIKPDEKYWFVREFQSKQEVTFFPIPEDKWAPYEAKSAKLLEMKDETVTHDLGFVPAHWFARRTGKYRPYDGRCFWENAIPNVIEIDYTLSQMGAGVRYNAAPQVVIKGRVQNANEDGSLTGGPSRYLQFDSDKKDPDGISDSGADAHMLESTGQAMKVGIENYAGMCRELALWAVCASLKDPNKVTTAMSGRAMQALDREFYDLIKEIRTVFGENGFLKLLKKIGMACVLKRHPLAQKLKIQQIDGLTLGWPPLEEVGAIEFQALCTGLGTAVENAFLDKQKAEQYLLSQVDMPIQSANKDYLPTIEATKDETTTATDAKNIDNENGKMPTVDPKTGFVDQPNMDAAVRSQGGAASPMAQNGQLSTVLGLSAP